MFKKSYFYFYIFSILMISNSFAKDPLPQENPLPQETSESLKVQSVEAQETSQPPSSRWWMNWFGSGKSSFSKAENVLDTENVSSNIKQEIEIIKNQNLDEKVSAIAEKVLELNERERLNWIEFRDGLKKNQENVKNFQLSFQEMSEHLKKIHHLDEVHLADTKKLQEILPSLNKNMEQIHHKNLEKVVQEIDITMKDWHRKFNSQMIKFTGTGRFRSIGRLTWGLLRNAGIFILGGFAAGRQMDSTKRREDQLTMAKSYEILGNLFKNSSAHAFFSTLKEKREDIAKMDQDEYIDYVNQAGNWNPKFIFKSLSESDKS